MEPTADKNHLIWMLASKLLIALSLYKCVYKFAGCPVTLVKWLVMTADFGAQYF